jgi:integrase
MSVPLNAPMNQALANGLRCLGHHHFAHLRAIAEGLPLVDCALRYLCIEHGHEAAPAHTALVTKVRALGKKNGSPDWRLIGLVIREKPNSNRPSLEQFIEDRDLDGFSESEAREFYEEAYPPDRRLEQRRRLRERQLRLLSQLQGAVAKPVALSDSIEDWFDPKRASRFERAGIRTLGDLQTLVQAGGSWWRAIPSVGRTKAAVIAGHLETLIPGSTRAFAKATFSLSKGSGLASSRSAVEPTGLTDRIETPSALLPSTVDSVSLEAPLSPAPLLRAESDSDAVEAWVRARAGSVATAKLYRREALRLMLWLHKRGLGLQSMTLHECLDYMAFLANIPPSWISKEKHSPLTPGWAPFRGPLSVESQRQTILILGGLFSWLTATRYLSQGNPWLLVNRRIGDDANRIEMDTRAFTPEAWLAILRFVDAQAPSPSQARIRFVLRFTEGTGLRASELLGCKLGDFRHVRGRLALQVQGKGARNRVIAVPPSAAAALQEYLLALGHASLPLAPPEHPLLASIGNSESGITYPALYQSMRLWMKRCIHGAELDMLQRAEAERASPHWLRHTCGTRAVERGAPLDVVQKQFGHADPRTTSRYSRAQLERLQDVMDAAFKG